MIYILIGCFIIIGFLGIKLIQKQQIDKGELEKYRIELAQESEKLEDCKEELEDHLALLKEMDASIEKQRQARQQELEKTFEESKEKYALLLQKAEQESQELLAGYKAEIDQAAYNTQTAIANYTSLIREAREKYEGILAPLQMYERERQERLFYTIQLPEEYHEDIDYLLTVVSEKIQHPDIINKLVWSNYVKPYLDDLCRRAEIKDEPGIYKITNMDNGKSYIGKSTNVKKRIQDHMKSVVGIEAIADQAVHHEIFKTGFWNWTFEVVTYCEKEKLSELEKYYINFFKTQEYGFNIRGGG